MILNNMFKDTIEQAQENVRLAEEELADKQKELDKLSPVDEGRLNNALRIQKAIEEGKKVRGLEGKLLCHYESSNGFDDEAIQPIYAKNNKKLDCFASAHNDVYITTIDHLSLKSGIPFASCYETFDKDGNILKTDVGKDKIFTTNENGEINLGENEILAPGTYYYKETKTKDGYIKDENIYSFTIKENGEVEYSQKDGLHYKEKIVDKAEQNNSKNKDGKDNPGSLPNAGKGMLGLSILTLILSAGIGYVKYKKYKI